MNVEPVHTQVNLEGGWRGHGPDRVFYLRALAPDSRRRLFSLDIPAAMVLDLLANTYPGVDEFAPAQVFLPITPEVLGVEVQRGIARVDDKYMTPDEAGVAKVYDASALFAHGWRPTDASYDKARHGDGWYDVPVERWALPGARVEPARVRPA